MKVRVQRTAATGGRVYGWTKYPFSRKVGLGIDTTTGSVAFADTDITVAGPIPLSFTRYYNAHADRRGTLGYRWSHTYDTRLEILSNGDTGAIYGSGREEFFLNNSGTFSAADPRVHSTLVGNGDGTYTLTTKDNIIYRFTSAGVLTTIEDLNGNTVSLAYDGQGRLSTVTGAGGRTLTLATTYRDAYPPSPIRQVPSTPSATTPTATSFR